MRKVFMITFLTWLVISNLQSQPGNSTIGLSVGNEAPDIKLPNPKGDSITLSSLRGKIVLIDFWASWCAPCLKEQPELRSVYKKYGRSLFANAKGFNIYGVSLDSKKMDWKNTIKKYKMEWTQVSDLKYWNSEAARLYKVEEIPYNLLIDGGGIIIARNLHGEDLNRTLSQLLKNN